MTDRTYLKHDLQFVNNPYRYKHSDSKQQIEISQIYQWYDQDFQKQYGSVKNFLARCLSQKGLSAAQIPKLTISYQSYDWGLNNAE